MCVCVMSTIVAEILIESNVKENENVWEIMWN
jgi:hypothetical protein